MDGERSGVRASDRERELVVERLTRALGHGRLTLDEYDQRGGAGGGRRVPPRGAAAVYSCLDRDDVARLTDDLPGRLW